MATKYDQDAKAKAVRLEMSAETLRKWVRRAAIDDGHAAGVSTAESRKLPRGVDLGPGFLQLDLLAGLAWAARSRQIGCSCGLPRGRFVRSSGEFGVVELGVPTHDRVDRRRRTRNRHGQQNQGKHNDHRGRSSQPAPNQRRLGTDRHAGKTPGLASVLYCRVQACEAKMRKPVTTSDSMARTVSA